MHEGHEQDTWIHTSHLICTLFNVNRGPKSKPLKFTDVYPFGKDQPQANPAKQLSDQEIAFEAEMAKALWLGVCGKREAS